MTINTVTIPLEATTAVQLFSFLNITLGVGADLAFGKNDMSLGVSGDVHLDNSGLPSGAGTITQTPGTGNLSVDAGGTMPPSFFHPKIMTGIGFKIGPVILDIPVTYYFLGGTGLNLGVTLGFTW
jgi:hypothetical protein